MNRLRRLDIRLFISYAIVVMAGAATLTIIVSLLAPPAFDNHMTDMNAMTGTHAGTNSHRHFFIHMTVVIGDQAHCGEFWNGIGTVDVPENLARQFPVEPLYSEQDAVDLSKK